MRPSSPVAASLFAALAPERVLLRDAHLVAVDKDAHVPSQPPGDVDERGLTRDGLPRDDLPHRVATFLAQEEGLASAPRLGAHLHLEQEASGVAILGRTKEANAGLARALEGRVAPCAYLAAVSAARGGSPLRDTTLSGVVARGRGGAFEVVGGRRRGDFEAVTRVRVRERRGDRALVELEVERGRPAQLRAQLAHAGFPVAGDLERRGAFAPRLLLHAERLRLPHPVTGAALDLRAPVPLELRAFLEEGAAAPTAPAALDRALALSAQRRFALARAADLPAPTTAFRLVHGAADGLPGLAVDVYGDHLVAQLHEEELAADEDLLLDALGRLGFEGVYLKRRPRQANELVDTRDESLAPASPVRGSKAPAELEVREHGVPFLVRLGDGLSTGLFLDQRDNRRRVARLSPGRRVLNLFAYACAFTIAAARGGASRTLSVDASAAALERGARGLAHAGLASGGAHALLCADAFDALRALRSAGERFDLVIVDPPTYATTKRSRFRSGSDWRGLVAAALAVSAPGASLLLCSNDRRMGARAFEAHVRAGAGARAIARLEHLSPPRDFPAASPSRAHPKTLLVTLGEGPPAARTP